MEWAVRGSQWFPGGWGRQAGGWEWGSDQDVGAGHRAEGEVLDGALLQLHVSVAQLGAGPQHALYGGLGLREEVDELDVGGQQQGPCGHAAQVELGVQQGELHRGAAGRWGWSATGSVQGPLRTHPTTTQRRLPERKPAQGHRAS